MIEIPTCFLCPITKKLMKDPVIATDGITYEREAIQERINNNQPGVSESFVQIKVPNEELKQSIDQFEKRKKKSEENSEYNSLFQRRRTNSVIAAEKEASKPNKPEKPDCLVC